SAASPCSSRSTAGRSSRPSIPTPATARTTTTGHWTAATPTARRWTPTPNPSRPASAPVREETGDRPVDDVHGAVPDGVGARWPRDDHRHLQREARHVGLPRLRVPALRQADRRLPDLLPEAGDRGSAGPRALRHRVHLDQLVRAAHELADD